MHALLPTPALICLQVEKNTGAHAKDRTCVHVGDRQIHMPIFCQPDLTVVWEIYSVQAMTVHRGEVVRAGHYQAVLFDGKRAWMADDNQPPRQHELDDVDKGDVYLIWAVRSDHGGVETPWHRRITTNREQHTFTEVLAKLLNNAGTPGTESMQQK